MGTNSSDAPEEWRDVPGLPGYMVSTWGSVAGPRSILRPYSDADGYLRIGARGTSHLVHRLVAAAFLGPCPSDHEVGHQDHDRTNNRVGNLRYCTHAANVKATSAAGRSMKGERHVNATLTAAQVAEIRAGYRRGDGYKNWAARYGVGWSAIRHIVKGNTWDGSSPQDHHTQGERDGG